MNWRPLAGGEVALTDHELAKIGLMVVYEAAAKGSANALLKVVGRLSTSQWIRLERQQFGQVQDQIEKFIVGVDDVLEERVTVLRTALTAAYEHRHTIVHSVWGEGAESAEAYDYGRGRQLTQLDLDNGVEACAELKRAAAWALFRVAELIEVGTYNERPAGTPGMGIHTHKRLIRL